MAIEILYAQSYMQTNGQMTVDILLKNPETADIVIGMDMYNTDLPPKINGPRMVNCVPKNTPCHMIRYINIPFTDPYNIYVRRCISGPNCATSGCTTFSSFVDDTFMGEMVDFGSPGISGVPNGIFGPNAKYSTGLPPNVISSTVCAPGCQPPNGVQRYCGTDNKTIYVWNSQACRYDSMVCTTGHCTNGFCDTPPGPVISGLNISSVTTQLSTSDLFPGNQGWTRINVTVTGSGMLILLVNNNELLRDGPLNPGAAPGFMYTYLQKLSPGSKNICAQALDDTGVAIGNKVCSTITIPTVVPGVFTLIADKSAITTGDYVVFSGVYSKPGQKIGIHTTYGSVTNTVTNAIGEFKVGATVTTPSTVKETLAFYACAEGIVSGICPILADISNTITIDVSPKVIPPPPTAFTVSADKNSILSGDYVVFSGKYKPGMKVGIYSNKGYITTTVPNAAGDYKVGSFVSITETTTQSLTIYACAEGAISGVCPLLADKSGNITITVAPMKYDCSGAPDYTCIKKPTGKYADPDTCRVECKAPPPPPPPVVEATHAFVINLSPLSWANLQGLTDSLPGLTTEMARAITLYGWLGWQAIESRIESGNKLVIYMKEPVSSVGSMRIRSLALPAIAAITAAIGVIAIWALKFGFLILGFYIVNLLTKSVEVAKTQADTEQIRTQTISDMCKSGQLSPEQCSEALKPPKEKGICETFGFSAVACDQVKTGVLVIGGLIGAYVIYRAVKKVTPSA